VALLELRASVAEVVLDVRPPSAALRVDARPVHVEGPLLRLDPGPHVLEWNAPGHHSARRDLSLRAGDRARVNVRLEAIGAPGWVVPTVVALTAAVVAGAVVTGVVLSNQHLPPYVPALGNFQEGP
jgi:hypothetical protein